MNILQYAQTISGRNHAQIIFHAGVPGFGQIFDFQRSFHEGDLKFETQHDMQVVSGLIRFNTDQGRFNLVDASIKRIQADVSKLGGEEFHQFGIEELPEGFGTADQIFPHARL